MFRKRVGGPFAAYHIQKGYGGVLLAVMSDDECALLHTCCA